jgi:dCTP deaminase
MGGEDIHLITGDRVVQMIFHDVSPGNRLYNGRYQDSLGVIEAK